MPPTRRHVLGLTAVTLSLAGCLGPGSADYANATSGAATVTVRNHPEYGDILVDADGLTLYRFDQDTQGSGESACGGDCTDAWPPLSVSNDPSAGPEASVSLSTSEHDGGVVQVAADGWPLYYYAADSAPGDAEGQGVNDAWWVVGPDGSKITATTDTFGRSY